MNLLTFRSFDFMIVKMHDSCWPRHTRKRSQHWSAGSSSRTGMSPYECIRFVFMSFFCVPANRIARKYRDEPRPRQGLLRGREFIMKDLYTFDTSVENALDTYAVVKQAYVKLFDELKLPYVVATADSGNMGGSLSHEFHVPSPKGEDTVLNCSSCNLTWNEELSTGEAYSINGNSIPTPEDGHPPGSRTTPEIGQHQADAVSTDVWKTISRDGATLVRVFYPKFLLQEGRQEPVQREVNTHAIKSISKSLGIDLDTSMTSPVDKWRAVKSELTKPTVLDLYDQRVRRFDRPPLLDTLGEGINSIEYKLVDKHPNTGGPLDCLTAHTGDTCPSCGQPAIRTLNTIELAHTFHLGTRYSSMLKAGVAVPSAAANSTGAGSGATAVVPLEMGCHGIGVSRMLSAAADSLSDTAGLNWPRAIAPFEAVIVADKGLEALTVDIYDCLTTAGMTALRAVDAVIDDRPEKSLVWKLRDADLVGYPVTVVVGRAWRTSGEVEVQCRRLEVRETVTPEGLAAYVHGLLERL